MIPFLAWCPNVFPTPLINPFAVETSHPDSSHNRRPKRIHIPNSEQSQRDSINSSVTSLVSAASSSLIVAIIAIIQHIVRSSWPYEMTPDMTFVPLVPSAAFTLMSASVLATPKPSVHASGSTPTTRCGASMPPTRNLLPVQHDLTTPRARARAARLRANEAAERREDLAALVTTPVGHRFVHYHSFICQMSRRRSQYDTNRHRVISRCPPIYSN